MFIPDRPQNAKFRTLVVLLDGTGDSVDEDITNIVHLKYMLYDQESDKQMVLYLRGIGSRMDRFDPEYDDKKAHPWTSWIKRTWDQAFASTFSDHVITPYTWLAENYRDGDKICIFGFSRGAYTARVLAGMINAVGLLPNERANESSAKAAYNLYDNFAELPGPSEKDEVRETAWLSLQTQFQDFRVKERCLEVLIEFLGCWDTVNSVGYVRAIKLGFTRTNDIVRTFRHAISLDEHRVKFKQNNWSGPAKEIPNPADRPNDKKPRVKTDVEEVWFAGCHCDIGGGSVLNGTRPNLAHISLRWMVRECFKTNNGMIFDSREIRVIGIDPSTIYPVVKPRPDFSLPFSPGKISVVKRESWRASLTTSRSKPKGSTLQAPSQTEEELDALDALAPAYDQLKLKPSTWAAMEQLPMNKDKKAKDGKWGEVKERHMSRGRTIPPTTASHGGKIKVHRTVQMRMNSKFERGEEAGKTYIPLARVGYTDTYEEKTTFDEALEKGWIEWVA